MPPVQPPSKMPKGLTPEEKKEYQKERNRKKQAALRARRAAKGKEEAEAASPSQSPPIASTSNDGSARPSPSALRGSWNSLDESTRVGFVEALARSHAEVARLTSTVGRLVGKLAELGIDDQTIGMLLREGSCGTPSSRQSPSSSLSSLAADSPTEIPDSHPSCFANKEQSMLYMLASTSTSSPSQLDLASAPPPPPTQHRSSFPTSNHTSWSNESYSCPSTVDPQPLSFSEPLSINQPYPSVDSFALLSTSQFNPGLDAEMLRQALNLTQQPVPSPLFNFNPFAQTETLGGTSFWHHQQPPRQQQSFQESHLSHNLPLQTSKDTYLETLFELHLAYRTSRRRSLANPTYHSTVSETAIKELQLVILRLLTASSDQRDAYICTDAPLSAADQAYLVSGEVDERLTLIPTRPIVKVISGRTAHMYDVATMVAEIIEGTRIFGDVFDISGWTMPGTFWSDYKFEVPDELAGVCVPTDPNTIPVGLRGSTIR
ncbi:hypothetical protein BDY24DRAFT_373148 [Mrakia frigida]|uniref:uncharacterized protein n=1 Tax=Mrakia frigida TaxID=29902 RepID=UPI003FCC1E52